MKSTLIAATIFITAGVVLNLEFLRQSHANAMLLPGATVSVGEITWMVLVGSMLLQIGLMIVAALGLQKLFGRFGRR